LADSWEVHANYLHNIFMSPRNQTVPRIKQFYDDVENKTI